ncbi:MAG: sugar phosphate isomerase/epimerase [Clostridia bacterium]|nr:sugar phosphate isomerase/epimerase [Clostridia bacterium]
MKNLRERLYIATFSKDALKVIKEEKLNIEVNDTCISEDLDDTASLEKRIKDEVKSCEAKKVFIHGPFTEIHPAAIDHRIVEAGLVRLNEAYQVTKDISKDMVVHSGYVPFIYIPVWQVEKSIEFWKRFMEDKPKDFHIYIENVLEDSPHMLKEIVRGVDDERVKICLDVGHANAMMKDDDVYRWVEFLGKDIGHFHIHNNFKDGDSHLSLGEGSVDFEKLFDVIDKSCDDVTFTIEDRDCIKSVKWLKERGYI